MARFRLRTATHELELPEGAFTIGRSSTCDLAVDDVLVSRRHLLLRVAAEQLLAEDLGSRNGVLINGLRLARPTEIHGGDCIQVGSQEFRVLVLDSSAADPEAGPKTGSQEGVPTSRVQPSGSRRLDPARVAIEPETGDTTAASIHSLLIAVADKAMNLESPEDSGRVVDNLLRSLWGAIARGVPPAEEHLRGTTKFLLTLAEKTTHGSWLDKLFELYGACGRVLDDTTLERLHDIVRRIKYSNPTALRAYLEVLRRRQQTMNANERFRMSRLESLLRLVSPTS
ncbi:MAG: FHA domain-containing protein [Deltaproteobacteria bacterium]|nr:FHA domain-containing protein [Deltaproteobacteria bacterium]